MKRKKLLISALFVFGCIAVYLLLYSNRKPERPNSNTANAAAPNVSSPVGTPISPSKKASKDVTGQVISAEREREKKMWDLWLATPILFYGKVVDEKNNPISDATALIFFVDTLGTGNDHTKITKKTDSAGAFVADGHGLAVVVMVLKEGYYKQKTSDGTFGYVQGGNFAPHTDPSNPAIFILRKMGQTESLIATSLGGRLNKNGTPLNVDLQAAKKVSDGQGDLKIECWTNDTSVKVNSNESFDWRCRISVSAGGLVERKGEFDFEAPEAGYQPFVEINMPKSTGRDWRNSLTKEYFLKLANGTYARIQFMMNAGGEQTFYLTGYLNPKLGSRNLEYNASP